MSKKEKPSRAKKHEENLTKGILEITRSGIGYVVVDEEGGDVLVRPNDLILPLMETQ
jgi:ribonuclease R